VYNNHCKFFVEVIDGVCQNAQLELQDSLFSSILSCVQLIDKYSNFLEKE